MKFTVTAAKDIGKQGDGQYVLIHPTTKKVLKVQTYISQQKIVDESQRELTDVHALLEPAIKRGLLRHATKFTEEYDDIPAIDYQEALNTVAKADQMFAELPTKWKNRFNQDPNEFLKFVHDPANGNEMISMGMIQGNDGFNLSGQPSGAPTDLNKDGRIDTVDTNLDGVPDSNPKIT
jgi:phage internal scaffolding protein